MQVSLPGNAPLKGLKRALRSSYRQKPTGAYRLLIGMLQIALVLSMLVPLTAQAQGLSGAATLQRVSTALVQAATANPQQTFRVIVVRDQQNTVADSHVLALGGKTIEDVANIGFVTQLNAAEIASLAVDPTVKYITLDARMLPVSCSAPLGSCDLNSIYPQAIKATEDWSRRAGATGQGVGVAVVDTGIAPKPDFLNAAGGNRIVAQVSEDANSSGFSDGYGHGTHVAGIIGGNSWWNPDPALQGQYIGVAPEANLINVKVSDDQGMTYMSDVINGIDWAIANRKAYNIRVLNLSLESTVPESYTTSLLDAEVEKAWFNGILVVAAAGNNGPNSELYAPGNDPFVLTVGASDPNNTVRTNDDTLAPWSSYGRTQDGFSKPDVVAPGRYITSVLASPSSVLAQEFPSRVVDGQYLWLSGTSMSAAVVSGMGALVFQSHPTWSNDQAKWVLEHTATSLYSNQRGDRVRLAGQGKGEVDALTAVRYDETPRYSDQGLTISTLLTGPNGSTTYWNPNTNPSSSSWSSSSWSSSSWSSSSWSSSSWSSSSWSSSSWSSSSWSAETQP